MTPPSLQQKALCCILRAALSHYFSQTDYPHPRLAHMNLLCHPLHLSAIFRKDIFSCRFAPFFTPYFLPCIWKILVVETSCVPFSNIQILLQMPLLEKIRQYAGSLAKKINVKRLLAPSTTGAVCLSHSLWNLFSAFFFFEGRGGAGATLHTKQHFRLLPLCTICFAETSTCICAY